jgi:hypothetical protein
MESSLLEGQHGKTLGVVAGTLREQYQLEGTGKCKSKKPLLLLVLQIRF